MSNINSERYLFNSDLLQIAQAGNHAHTITRPAYQENGGNHYGGIEINAPTVKGAIALYMVEYEVMSIIIVDGKEVQESRVVRLPIGQQGYFQLQDDDWYTTDFFISRKNQNTLVLRWQTLNVPNGTNVDALTFRLRVQYIYPPNVL